jgi:hypothetical protein
LLGYTRLESRLLRIQDKGYASEAAYTGLAK